MILHCLNVTDMNQLITTMSYVITEVTVFSPSCSVMSFLDSSSVVAKPFTSFCLATGGGVGGREAGGVGGLLRLSCWRKRWRWVK